MEFMIFPRSVKVCGMILALAIEAANTLIDATAATAVATASAAALLLLLELLLLLLLLLLRCCLRPPAY